MSLETSAAAGPQDTTGGFDTVVAVSEGAARIADSTTLLHGTYSRLGQDLLIEAPDGTRTLVTDFFQAGRPTADLTGPGGETLSGALVARLAGP
ncbi:MAG: hypothetical protein LDL44_17480, partial [Caenispirillum sp.]|nr:hypothetical protein [Caenispirillum sp.]